MHRTGHRPMVPSTERSVSIHWRKRWTRVIIAFGMDVRSPGALWPRVRQESAGGSLASIVFATIESFLLRRIEFGYCGYEPVK